MNSKGNSYILPNKEHLDILKEKFDIESFKTEQWCAISSLIHEKRDVVICAKSGFGKSLIYQFPPVFLGKKSLIISPLISLMETQVQNLQVKGIEAFSISGQQKGIGLNFKNYSIIYSTPENFKTVNGLLKWAAENDEICLVAIDEAHCVTKSSAGHRHAYSILKNIKEHFPTVPIVALTSTASNQTTENICSVLNLNNPLLLKTSLDLPNIKYISEIQTPCFITDVKKYLIDIPKNEAAIIYVFKRAETENYSQILSREGFESRPYHSGLVEKIRRETLRDFISRKLNFLVTTNAFGMGVDRPDVRVVIHYGIPKNPETYYMESGRAGRDGKPSISCIFWSEKDYKFHTYCFKENYKNKIVSNSSFGHCEMLLGKMKEYAMTTNCRRATLLGFLEETVPSINTDSCCDNCLQLLHDRVGIIKMYKEISPDGHIDVTKDVRTVLNLINSYQGKCKMEILVDFITGTTMPIEFSPFHPVQYYGCGINKTKSWWLNILKFIKDKRFIERHTVVTSSNNFAELLAQIAVSREDYIRSTTKGLKFLRMKTKKCFAYPQKEYFQSMTKTDTEYFILNGNLKERPRNTSKNDSVKEDDSDDNAFDLTGFKSQLQKTSPKKRLASDSEFSDISLTELFKSPKLDDVDSPKSPKMLRLDNQPGCSHWSANNNSNDTSLKSLTARETRSSCRAIENDLD